MHPIYGPGEIACNANLLVMPLSLGQEGGPALVAPIKGCWSTLLRENLRNDDRRTFVYHVSKHVVATLCSLLNLQRALITHKFLPTMLLKVQLIKPVKSLLSWNFTFSPLSLVVSSPLTQSIAISQVVLLILHSSFIIADRAKHVAHCCWRAWNCKTWL